MLSDWWMGNDLVSKKNIRRFIGLYAREDNWHHMDTENGGLGYGWIHYSLIRLLKPKNILCIGSRWGGLYRFACSSVICN